MADETRPFMTQIEAAFEELNYPIENETDLVPNFPSWANTRFQNDELSMTPREAILLVPNDYPYESVDELVKQIELALEKEGKLTD